MAFALSAPARVTPLDLRSSSRRCWMTLVSPAGIVERLRNSRCAEAGPSASAMREASSDAGRSQRVADVAACAGMAASTTSAAAREQTIVFAQLDLSPVCFIALSFGKFLRGLYRFARRPHPAGR